MMLSEFNMSCDTASYNFLMQWLCAVTIHEENNDERVRHN